jgi:hypothetical protein
VIADHAAGEVWRNGSADDVLAQTGSSVNGLSLQKQQLPPDLFWPVQESHHRKAGRPLQGGRIRMADAAEGRSTKPNRFWPGTRQ